MASNYTLILNSSNLTNVYNKNIYTYKFLTGNLRIPSQSEICISSVQIPYSIFNITSIYGNNTLSFIWPVGATTQTFNVIIPDGYYSVSDMQLFLELYFINNGLYLLDANGNNVYYFVMSYNVTYYAVQLLFFTLPTSLPPGFTQPANFIGYPTVARTPILDITTGTFNVYIGYSPGTYGSQLNTANSSFNSNITPVGSTVNSLVLRCNLVDNSVSRIPDVLDSFTIGATQFGTNINYEPAFQKYVKIKSGNFSDLTIQIDDQDGNTIRFLDSNVLITLILRMPV